MSGLKEYKIIIKDIPTFERVALIVSIASIIVAIIKNISHGI